MARGAVGETAVLPQARAGGGVSWVTNTSRSRRGGGRDRGGPIKVREERVARFVRQRARAR